MGRATTGLAGLVTLLALLTVAQPGLAGTPTTLYLSDSASPAAIMSSTLPVDHFFLGRLIEAGGAGSGETDPNQHQVWHTSSGGITISGAVSLTFWGAMVSLDPGQDGTVNAYLLDCEAGKINCVTIRTAALTVDHLLVGMGNWSEQVIDFGTVDHVIDTNHKLGVKVIVDSNSSADLWMLYATPTHPSRLTLDTTPLSTTTTTTSTTTTMAPPSATTSTAIPSVTTSTPPVASTTTTPPTTATTAPPTPTPGSTPPTSVIYSTPTSIASVASTSSTTTPFDTAPPTSPGTSDQSAPVQVTAAFPGSNDPGPDGPSTAETAQPAPISATFLLTPERRNGGLTPTRVLGVVFHVIVENLNFNLLPAVVLGAVTAWFTMKGVKPDDEVEQDLGSGWVV